MSRIITTTVYTLHELSSTAQEKPATGTVSIMLTATGMKTCEDFREVCGIFGIDLRQRVFRLSNGRFMEEPSIWFSGFCGQGTEPVLKDAGTGSQRQPGKSGNMPCRTVSFIVSRMPCRWCRNVTSGNLQTEIHHRGRGLPSVQHGYHGYPEQSDWSGNDNRCGSCSQRSPCATRPSGCTVNWKTSTTG